ncbi:hypothetical protein CDAR_554401 [Caerostris darwini]|uniref:Uncharacterized protein n=1 Tax=Caerostris darwini TaxID=1538125 RepID=A0AAV4SJD4_9ARAC|nr:hypothetical protein CDAR_554401 [Caerostris darwini]
MRDERQNSHIILVRLAKVEEAFDLLKQSNESSKKTKRSRKMVPTICKRNETSNSYDVLEVEEITIDDLSNDITSAPSMQNSVNNDISGMNSMHIDEEFPTLEK